MYYNVCLSPWDQISLDAKSCLNSADVHSHPNMQRRDSFALRSVNSPDYRYMFDPSPSILARSVSSRLTRPDRERDDKSKVCWRNSFRFKGSCYCSLMQYGTFDIKKSVSQSFIPPMANQVCQDISPCATNTTK